MKYLRNILRNIRKMSRVKAACKEGKEKIPYIVGRSEK